MHIEPGVVEGAKIVLSYVTAAGAIGYAAKTALKSIRHDGVVPMAARCAIATLLVFSFFQILPHYAVGVSEVHLILGSTLFLLRLQAKGFCAVGIGFVTFSTPLAAC